MVTVSQARPCSPVWLHTARTLRMRMWRYKGDGLCVYARVCCMWCAHGLAGVLICSGMCRCHRTAPGGLGFLLLLLLDFCFCLFCQCIFQDKILYRTWSLLFQLQRRVMEPMRSTCLHPPPSTWVTGTHCSTQLFHGFWKSECRSSCLHKLFIQGTIPQNQEGLFIPSLKIFADPLYQWVVASRPLNILPLWNFLQQTVVRPVWEIHHSLI